jgi:hypothetical protein
MSGNADIIREVTSQMMVDLVPVDEDVLEDLLALAVAEAQPGEVMPPASGESADEPRTSWTARVPSVSTTGGAGSTRTCPSPR